MYLNVRCSVRRGNAPLPWNRALLAPILSDSKLSRGRERHFLIVGTVLDIMILITGISKRDPSGNRSSTQHPWPFDTGVEI